MKSPRVSFLLMIFNAACLSSISSTTTTTTTTNTTVLTSILKTKNKNNIVDNNNLLPTPSSSSSSSSSSATLTCEICLCWIRNQQGIVDCSNMGLDVIPPDIPPSISSPDGRISAPTTSLWLQGNSFPSIPSGTFDRRRRRRRGETDDDDAAAADDDIALLLPLATLYLHDNPHLETLETGAFRGLPRLTNLIVHHTSLTSLPACLVCDYDDDDDENSEMTTTTTTTTTALERLWLNDGLISEIHPSAFRGMSNVRELFLDGNEMEGVDEEEGAFDDLIRLEVLRL